MKSILSRSLTVLLVALLSFSSLGILNVNSQVEDTWIELASMNTSRDIGGLAVVENKIYAIGGTKDGEYLSTNEMYDPATDTWTTKASMPTPRSGFAIAVAQNKIHVIGGIIDLTTPTNAHEIYNPQADTWETKDQAPLGFRIGIEANVVKDKIYIISGSTTPYRPWINTNNNDIYDPVTDSWTTGAPIPTSVFSYGSTTLDDKIYIIGGRSIPDNKTYSLNQIYDPLTDTWSLGASIPVALSGAMVTATSGEYAPKRIYSINGYICEGDGGILYSEEVYVTQIYDPAEDSWSSNAQTISRRGNLVVVDDILYLIDGYNGSSYSSFTAKYTPIGYSNPEPSSTPIPELEFLTTTALASVVMLIIAGIGILVYFKKYRKK